MSLIDYACQQDTSIPYLPALIQTRFYLTVTKDRIEELPRKDELSKDIVSLIISKEIQDSLRREAVHELFIIDDVKTFRSVLKQCHNNIRNNEGYDPTDICYECGKNLKGEEYCKRCYRVHLSTVLLNV